ncbi:hypothetical protein RJ641_013326 [Dillenia turbinata]|uniref:Uncharacterized protein n=1 Tax=Dillenia turbinata TaxID=194707 RepID=A0AAN8ZQD7_9MAGN
MSTFYSLRNYLNPFLFRRRLRSTNPPIQGQTSDVVIQMHKGRGLQLITASSAPCGSSNATMVRNYMSKAQPSEPPLPPPPPRPRVSVWIKWIFGTLLSLLLPFWNVKWQKFLEFEEEAQKVVEETEDVAKVVEKVATAAEEVSEDVAEMLPDNSKLKQAALFVEHISKVAASDAQFTENVIHKVDALRHDMKDLETLVEPVIHKIVDKNLGGK